MLEVGCVARYVESPQRMFRRRQRKYVCTRVANTATSQRQLGNDAIV